MPIMASMRPGFPPGAKGLAGGCGFGGPEETVPTRRIPSP